MQDSLSSNEPSQQSLATLFGGRDLTVTRSDGTTETVRVKELKIAELQPYLGLCDTDDLALAELLCEKPSGWAANLTTESLLQIGEVGEELNFTNARRWVERRLRHVEALGPVAQKATGYSKSLRAS